MNARIMLFCFFVFLPHFASSKESGNSAPFKMKLALNWKAEPQFGGFYEAQQQHFKKHGIEMEVLEGGSGSPTLQMLQNQKVDLAIVSAEEILISRAKTKQNPVMAVFASFQTNPQIIMTHEESKFQSIKELFESADTLAVQSGLSYFLFLKNKFGPPKGKTVPYQGGINYFLNDLRFHQQGFLTSEPLAATKAGKKVKNFLIADEGFNPYTTVVAVRVGYWMSHPERVKSAIKAIREGWESYLKNPEPTNLMMSKINRSMDPETFRKSAEAQIPLIQTAETAKSGLGVMTLARWKTLSEQMKKLQLLPADWSDKKIEEVFTNIER